MDERRSRYDKVGNNIAQQKLSNQRSNAQNSSQTTDNDTKSKVAENEERMGVLLSTIFNEFSPNLEPNAIDMERILNIMVINDQLIHFKDEFNKLRLGIPIGKDSKLFKLNPFFCTKDKTIKMNTRLARAEVLPEQVKYPKILDKDSRLAEMIIIHHHVTNAHAGHSLHKEQCAMNFGY